MGLFRRTERRSLSYQDVWGSGGDLNTYRMSADKAISLVPVYASIRLLADSIASMPIKQYKMLGDSRREVDVQAGFLRPGVYEGSTFSWKYRVVTSLALRGNAYGLIAGLDSSGYPNQIVWLHPDDVRVDVRKGVERPQWYVWGRKVSRDMIVHIPLFELPGEILGVSPIVAFAQTMDVGLLAQKFGRDFFDNGSTPSGIIEVDNRVNEEDASIIKRRFSEATKNHGVGVLGMGAKYRPISVPPNEAQFLETIRANASLIAAIYGVPPEMVGGVSGNPMTYSNEEQHGINFVNFSLRPWIVRLESAFDQLIPRGNFVKFNIDSMVRTDLKTRYESYQIARGLGLLSINEMRSLEERPPIPGGDDYTPLEVMKRVDKGAIENA